MINHDGKNIEKAFPSTPVEILGMNDVAFAGAEFLVTENEDKAKEISEFKSDKVSANKIILKEKSAIFETSQKRGVKCYFKIRCSRL